jgi:hypothetical protein
VPCIRALTIVVEGKSRFDKVTSSFVDFTRIWVGSRKDYIKCARSGSEWLAEESTARSVVQNMVGRNVVVPPACGASGGRDLGLGWLWKVGSAFVMLPLLT